MGNGSKQDNGGLIINTNAFRYEDVNLLCNILQLKYKLVTNPRLQGNNQ